jgi:hypothetical protein
MRVLGMINGDKCDFCDERVGTFACCTTAYTCDGNLKICGDLRLLDKIRAMTDELIDIRARVADLRPSLDEAQIKILEGRRKRKK